MSTFVAHYGITTMLDTLITSKTRLKLLLKFFISATNTGHLRGLAQEFQESTNAIRKELNQLSEAGILEKETDRNRIVYRANQQHTLFKPLQHLIHSYLGIDNYVDTLLDRVGTVQRVSLIGGYANGQEEADVEVLVLGEDLQRDYLLELSNKVSGKIGKNIILYFDKPVKEERQIILYEEGLN